MQNRRKFDPKGVTTKSLGQLLPSIMGKMAKTFEVRPDLILAAWPSLIGPNFAPMTEAISFVDGVLTVKVKNSSLNALLNAERSKLLAMLRSKFPQSTIKAIVFRMG